MNIVQHIKTNNDVNGNPRRLWVVYEIKSRHSIGRIVGVFEEGYGDKPAEISHLPEITSVYVGGAEYQRYKRVGKANKIYRHAS